METGHARLAGSITAFINDFVAKSPENCLKGPYTERAWDAPLVGFSSGADPLYLECKRHIGEQFWLPAEAFALAFPDRPAQAEDLTVIAWILPQTQITRLENQAQEVYPSSRWSHARLYGEQFNALLRREVAAALMAQGVDAAPPMLLPQWRMFEDPRWVWASNWSERHAAHISGLGAFGLCDGLITPKGKAVRVGSVVARARLEPTPRPYTDHHAYCLRYSHGTCGKCIPRCPVKALSDQGHDKVKCARHTRITGKEHNQKTFGLDIEGCGLCQVGVPCMDQIPDPEEG